MFFTDKIKDEKSWINTMRLNSTRLPNKPLKIIKGLPMFAHVYFRSKLSKLNEVYICTDSIEIEKISKSLGIKCIMTKKIIKMELRDVQAVGKLDLNLNDIIIDIQGDEPLVNPEHINSLIDEFYAM